MPMGASPANRLGGRTSAGRTADLNSSHGDDHCTSSRGGSGHRSSRGRSMNSGMVATSDIIRRRCVLSSCWVRLQFLLGCAFGLRYFWGFVCTSVPEKMVIIAGSSLFLLLFLSEIGRLGVSDVEAFC